IVYVFFFFFFFQAEDGIRDADVTGVQTCALPISDPLPADNNSRRNCSCGAVPQLQFRRELLSAGSGSGEPFARGCEYGDECGSEIGRASCRERVESPEVGGGVKEKSIIMMKDVEM